MTTLDDRNGHMPPLATPAAPAAGTDEPRIRFGDRDNQIMPLSWAETMLSELKNRSGKLFGELLYLAATGDDLRAYDRTRRGRDTAE